METATRPEWMNDEFLSTCIINSKNLPKDSSIDISDVKLFYAVPKGENYFSIIFRVKVNYHINDGTTSNESTDSLIVKVSPETEKLKEIVKELKIFFKEMDMYFNIMPKITETLENAGIDANIVCRCLHSVEEEKDILVLEDLNKKGFVLADRMTGLDLAHTKVVLIKLAKLHAGSMHYFNANEVPEMYLTTPFEKRKDMVEVIKLFEASMHQKIGVVIAEMKNNPKYGNHIIEFFEKYDRVLMDVMDRDYTRIPGSKFNAMIHGDCWVNNMMFKYNEDGSVNDVVFIDLQVAYNSSIALDFVYFFFTSTNKEVRQHHFQDLKEFYIDSLKCYLKKLGYAGKISTLVEFEEEIKRIIIFIINTITSTNAVILAEHGTEDIDRTKKESFEMEEMINTDTATETYMNVFLMSIDLLEENGYFENYNLPEAKSTD